MAITAICDSSFGYFLKPIHYRPIYVLYQTVLMTSLSIIIFYLPQRTITYLSKIEKTKTYKERKVVELQDIFQDNDEYHNFTRFMVQEYNVENLLYISQWIQIQHIITESAIDVNLQNIVTENVENKLLWLPSDILYHSNNILEATRGLYDKFVISDDVLQINISHTSRSNLNTFFNKHNDIKRIFQVCNSKDNEINELEFKPEDRTTVIADDVKDNEKIGNIINNINHRKNAIKYALFVDHLKKSKIENEIIQEMIDAFSHSLKDCWKNAEDSFRRYQFLTYRTLASLSTFDLKSIEMQ